MKDFISNTDTILIYTDGSCDDNRKDQGTGGYSAIIYRDRKPVFISGYETKTTNQRMEMMAVITALEYIKEPSDITICTDSAYICNCIENKWYDNWRHNGWKNAKGDPVANRDMWEQMLTDLEFHSKVQFIKVKGHAENIFNNKCDQLAKDIVDFQQIVNKALRTRGSK